MTEAEFFYRSMVLKNRCSLSEVPEAFRSADICTAAIRECPSNFSNIPESVLNYEHCLLAVREAPECLIKIPERFIDRRLIREAFASFYRNKKDDRYKDLFLSYRKDMLEEIFSNSSFLVYLDGEIARIAVLIDGDVLEYIPEGMKTPEICRIAVANSGIALEHVPYTMREEEMCRLAVIEDGMALFHVPEPLRTLDMCLCALRSSDNADCFDAIPDPLIREGHEELFLTAIEVAKEVDVLKVLPECLRNKEFYLRAVKLSGQCIIHIPEEMRTPEICRIAAMDFPPSSLRYGCGPHILFGNKSDKEAEIKPSFFRRIFDFFTSPRWQRKYQFAQAEKQRRRT